MREHAVEGYFTKPGRATFKLGGVNEPNNGESDEQGAPEHEHGVENAFIEENHLGRGSSHFGIMGTRSRDESAQIYDAVLRRDLI
jgi:hypothetical protein